MSRIITTDSAGKTRTQLTKSIVVAIRELGKQEAPGNDTRDMAAFIALALIGISKTIEISVAAWEKRDYWVKADRFRMEWAWTGKLGSSLSQAVRDENWNNVALLAAQVGQKLSMLTVPLNHRLGKPWVGAWNKLMEGK